MHLQHHEQQERPCAADLALPAPIRLDSALLACLDLGRARANVPSHVTQRCLVLSHAMTQSSTGPVDKFSEVEQFRGTNCWAHASCAACVVCAPRVSMTLARSSFLVSGSIPTGTNDRVDRCGPRPTGIHRVTPTGQGVAVHHCRRQSASGTSSAGG